MSWRRLLFGWWCWLRGHRPVTMWDMYRHVPKYRLLLDTYLWRLKHQPVCRRCELFLEKPL